MSGAVRSDGSVPATSDASVQVTSDASSHAASHAAPHAAVGSAPHPDPEVAAQAGDGRVGSILVAAGAGTRLGSALPKALVEIAGRPLVAHAAEALAAVGVPPIVVVPAESRARFVAALQGLHIAGVVVGGATRSDSVRAGLEALLAAADAQHLPPPALVAVHDAARALTPPSVIHGALQAVSEASDVLAAAPGTPVADTLKRTNGAEILETVDRADLVAVQTPQVFRADALAAALDAGDEATDELGLVERLRAAGTLDGRIVIVPGSPWAHKVTVPDDLLLLEALAARAVPATPATRAAPASPATPATPGVANPTTVEQP